MAENKPSRHYGKILSLGAHFAGHGGLRINGALAELQLEDLRKEEAGEKTSLWSSPLVPSEIPAAFGISSVTPETVSAVLASAGKAGGLLDTAEGSLLSQGCCSFQRTAAAALEEGMVPIPAAFVSTSPICDDNPQLAGYLAEKYSREHFLIDVPADGGEETLSYVVSQLRGFVSFLEELTGRPLNEEAFAGAVEESNRARLYWLEANRIRRKEQPVMYGAAALRMAGGMLLQKLGLPGLTSAMADYALELSERVSAGAFLPCRRRLLWLHLFPLFDRGFMSFIESELGLVVAFEESSRVWWEEVDPGDPLPGLARRIIGNPLGGSAARRLEAIREMIEEYRIDGVVSFSHLGCTSLTGGAPLIARSLRGEGIPFLELSGDCLDNRSPGGSTLKTRLEAFAEVLEGR